MNEILFRIAKPADFTLNHELREIRGIAMTSDKDLHGTVILPSGANFRDSTPLILEHNNSMPVGEVFFEKKNGCVEFVARIANPEGPASLIERCEVAWQSVKSGLIKGVSIGASFTKENVKRIANIPTIMECTIIELSLTATPSNPGARILATRSQEVLEDVGSLDLDKIAPTVENINKSHSSTGKEKMNRFAARSSELTSARKLKLDRMAELQDNAATENRSLNEIEGAEYDSLSRDVATLDQDISRVEALVKREAESAKVVETDPVQMVQRAAVVHTGNNAVAFKGKVSEAALVAMGLAHRKKTSVEEAVRSMGLGGQAAQVITRAAAAVVNTTVASELTDGNPNKEMMEVIQEKSVLFNVGFQSAPFGKKFVEMVGLPTANSVSELGVKRMSTISFDEKTVPKGKIVSGIVCSEEALEDSDPALEPIVSGPLTTVCALKADALFFNPANAGGGPTDAPKSPWYGVTPIAGSANPRADFTALESEMESQVPGGDGFNIYIGPSVAKKLARMENTSSGTKVFKGLNEDGTGSIFGFDVVLVPFLDQLTDTVSGGGKDVTILAAHKDSIRLGYAPKNQGLSVRTYDQGIVDMDVGAGTSTPINLIQQNAVLFLAELRTNWIVARQNMGVALISGTDWDLS